MSFPVWLHFHFSLSCIGEGNGSPLHCSCLENPRDGGAWWTAIYGVTQSRTRLKWLSICLFQLLLLISSNTFVVAVQSLNHFWHFAASWTAACQASLSSTISQSLLKFMPIKSEMLANQLILWHSLLLWTSICPSISLFQGVDSSYQVAKVLELQLQHQSFQRIFRVDFL